MGPNPLKLFRSPPLTNGSRHHGPPGGPRKLIVALNSKPRDYEPNSVPLPSRPRMLPKQDSTGYIVDRILLPPNEIGRDGQPKPKRMTYIVGWKDLSAASLLVPAQDILDFVSPRELETWETNLEEELKVEREKLEEEEAILSTLSKSKRKRKRGRPPTHTQVQSAAAVEIETEDDTQERLTGGALSLSTPKKRRMKDFEGISEDEESPSRQLEQELYNAQLGHVDSIQDMDMDDLVDSDVMDLVQGTTSYRNEERALLEEDDLLSATPGQSGISSPATGLTTPLEDTVRAMRNASTPGRKKSTQIQSPQKPLHINGEEQWIVKQIEDDALYQVEDVGLVRYYKVRWEGDWPPDENPSWEPEKNLPAALIRNYNKLPKTRAKKLQNSGPGRPQKKSKPAKPQPTPSKKFRQTVLPWGNGQKLKGGVGAADGLHGRSNSATPQPSPLRSNGNGAVMKDKNLEDELVQTEEGMKPTNLSS